jgi:hypothetical protein
MRIAAALLMTLLVPLPCIAGGKPTLPTGLPIPLPTDELAGSIRGHLVRHLPVPLTEKSHNWGHMEYVTRGVKWHGLKPERNRSHQFDGTWRKMVVVAEKPEDTLVIDIRDLSAIEPGKLAFHLFGSMDVKIFADQQNWNNGRRLYAGSIHARARVKVLLRVEVASRLEKGAGFLPDAVFSIRVTHAHLSYDQMKVEHIGGVGGELARLLGDGIHDLVNQWKPELERDLLQRGNEAIIKAGTMKDIRISLSKLMRSSK